jgi:hypothetical protein
MSGIDLVAHYLATAAGIAAALLLIVAFIGAARRLGWKGPVDLGDAVDRVLDFGRGHDTLRDSHVNVELQDASGVVMDFGPYIDVTMQNGRGSCYKLREGKFEACNPALIKAGAWVDVSYQGGRVKECLLVQVDFRRQHLFIRSENRLDDVLARINGH